MMFDGFDYFTNNDPRVKTLLADIKFWKMHAQHSGLDIAIASTIQSLQFLSNLKPLADITMDQVKEGVIDFLAWLLDPKIPDLNKVTSYSSVSSNIVYKLATLLNFVGMKIQIQDDSPYIEKCYNSSRYFFGGMILPLDSEVTNAIPELDNLQNYSIDLLTFNE